jgi:hypothetical protein
MFMLSIASKRSTGGGPRREDIAKFFYYFTPFIFNCLSHPHNDNAAMDMDKEDNKHQRYQKHYNQQLQQWWHQVCRKRLRTNDSTMRVSAEAVENSVNNIFLPVATTMQQPQRQLDTTIKKKQGQTDCVES